MARYTEAVCRLCRRENTKLFLKGTKCTSGKCPVELRASVPGQHGKARKKVSEYGLQFREKQKAKRYYGVLESQFEKYFDMATKRPGVTGENMLSLLESRLDNVVYRLGFAQSRAEARQLVTHNHFLVNGKKVNIPSYLVKQSDVVSLKEKSKNNGKILSSLETNASKPIPKWLSYNPDTLEGTVVSLAQREDIDLPIQEHLIVELYSK